MQKPLARRTATKGQPYKGNDVAGKATKQCSIRPLQCQVNLHGKPRRAIGPGLCGLAHDGNGSDTVFWFKLKVLKTTGVKRTQILGVELHCCYYEA